MTTNADVTIAEVIEVARRKQALLTPETAGYLVLGAADQLAVSPVLVDEHLCSMQVDGGRVSMLSRRVAHPLDAERGLRLLLRRLLEVSSGRAPALSNVAALPPKGDLAGLLAELESALIPVNRGAASRALSRLARETIRARRPSFAPDELAPSAELGEDLPAAPPPAGDDTEPMQVGPDSGSRFEPTRDSQETINRHLGARDSQEILNRRTTSQDSGESLEQYVVSLEPSLPRFPLDSSGEPAGRASDAFGFAEEATTSRREAIAEPRAAHPSSEHVQELLDDCMPSSPPPAVDAAPSPALPPPTPPPARLATPQPSAALPPPTPPPPAVRPQKTPPPPAVQRTPAPAPVAPVLLQVGTPPPPAVAAPGPAGVAAYAVQAQRDPASDPILSSYPPPSARGVDELLQDFLKSTSRKQDRVAQDLRKMVGVDVAERKIAGAVAGSDRNESPFPHAGGATDFYTSTPPPRAAASLSSEIAHDDTRAPAPPRRRAYAAFAVIIVAALGGVALLRFEPGFLSGRTPAVVEQERRAAAEATGALAAHPPQACRATLVVTDVPQGAEVLVRTGVAPVDVERVPSGARLEFIALADGYAPRRAVIPQGAAWDAPSGKPRYELPIQLEKSRAKSGALDHWPPSEPGTVVGGQGTPGTVHVVTSPRGADVWMVAGGSPEAKLESLPCGAGMEIMIAATQQGQPLRRRLRIEATRLTPEPGGNIVTSRISATK